MMFFLQSECSVLVVTILGLGGTFLNAIAICILTWMKRTLPAGNKRLLARTTNSQTLPKPRTSSPSGVVTVLCARWGTTTPRGIVTRSSIGALQRNCEILVPLHRNSPDQWKKILLLVHPTPTHPSNLLKVEGNNTKLADAARESNQEKQLVKAFSSWWSTMLPVVLAALLAAEC
jgi:hypothetical protein